MAGIDINDSCGLYTKTVDNFVIKWSYYNLTIGKLWSLIKLTKNWSTLLQNNLRLPETVDEAVDRLMSVLEDEHKADLAIMQEKDLIDLHFSLGMAIRNIFRLHEPGSKLLASCGVLHPDDASRVIMHKLWLKLNYGD